MTNEVKCKLVESVRHANCETKLAYILIAVLFVSNIFILTKLCSKDKSKSIDKVITEWVDSNPKIILDSVQRYAEKEQSESQRKQQEQAAVNVKSNLSALRDEKNTGVANPKGSKVVIEFFDYNCGYCKMAAKSVGDIIGTDKDVKVIFRDLPILGEASTVAARYSVAVAIVEPNKYLRFYEALMAGDAKTTSGVIQALKAANIQVEKIERALKTKSAEIEKRLEENRSLAGLVGIQGTPAFIIGEELVPGYIDTEAMKSILNR
ncbi:MAG: DsbA family protein [Rickettsiales bacterium]|jgi:protein-disulfide isomerase|nr:DsbA family protein [Rickettsiales bacterium]